MATGTRTFGLHETLIEPQVLQPPPTRHALLAFLLTLAAILHIGTAGWSDIHNGVEGRNAVAAVRIVQGETTELRSESPFASWLTTGSFKLFGVSATAARIPIALAMLGAIACTFLIGERLVDYWRGFIAGLIHLCSLGAFIWGRVVTPEPIFAALLGGAIFCLVCGFQRQQTRRAWFAGVWGFVVLGVLTKGTLGLLYPAAIIVILAALYRQARLRFRMLLHWHFLLPFGALLGSWVIWRHLHNSGAPPELLLFGDQGERADGVPLTSFLLDHLVWWFPAFLLILPSLSFASRKIFRPHEFEFADALPLAWLAAGFIPLLVFPGRQDYQSISVWSALALWTASAWDRAPRSLRLTGLGLVALAGSALAFSAATIRPLSVPPFAIADAGGIRAMLVMIGLAVVIAVVAAAYFAWRERESLAMTIAMLGMVPVGLTMAEGVARCGPSFSLAPVAQYLRPRLGEAGEVLYEGSSSAGSSLRFYLERDPLLVGDGPEASLNPDAALERMATPRPVFLIIQKDRVPFWQEQLTERFHLYHQVTTSGRHVVLSNAP